MFLDTEMAIKYDSGSTKRNVLVETLASDDSNYIACQMRNQSFSVATDGSNDMKLYIQWQLAMFIYITFYIGDNVGFRNWTKIPMTGLHVLVTVLSKIPSRIYMHQW